MSTSTFPSQTIPKSKKNKAWAKRTIDAIVGMSDFRYAGATTANSDQVPTSSRHNTTRALALKTYLMYNGIIDDADYEHVLDPFKQGHSNTKFPSKLRNYNIIKPPIDLLQGEFIKRPLNYVVSVTNEDVVTERSKKINEMLVQNLYEHFLQNLGVEGAAQGELPNPEDVIEAASSSFMDNRAIMGQAALKYIFHHQDLADEFLDGFFHWKMAGEVVSHKRVVDDEVIYEIGNPLEYDYDKSPDIKYFQDGDWAICRKLLHPSDIIDEFRHELTKEQVLQLENPKASDTIVSSSLRTQTDHLVDDQIRRERLVEVLYVYWKSRKRVAFIEGVDEESGQPFELSLEEDEWKEFKDSAGSEALPKPKWIWTNEVWQGVRIDGDIYVGVEPSLVQSNSLNNNSKCKLPINGRRYSDINSPNVAYAMQMIPYQLLYNIYKYRLENAVAKGKDMIAQLDINLKPSDFTIEQWLEFADQTGILFVNYQKEGMLMNPQHQTVLDLTAKSIANYVQLLDFVLSELAELTGISRQRKGEVGQFDLKGVVEQSIVQSSNITEPLFDKYTKFMEKDLESLIDYAKVAFIENKAGSYVLPDGSIEYFSVDGEQFMETDFGISVTINSKQVQQLNEIKGLTQAFVQNGVPPDTIMKMMLSDNMSELQREIEKSNKEQERIQRQLEEAQQALQQEANAINAQKLQLDDVKNQRDNQTRIAVAEINAAAKEAGADQDQNDNGVLDQNEFIQKRVEDENKIRLDRDKLSQKDKQEKRVLKQQFDIHKDKMGIEEKKLKIAKAKPKTAK